MFKKYIFKLPEYGVNFFSKNSLVDERAHEQRLKQFQKTF